MAITGIDTIEGKQIIAAGAVSAKSAEMAYNDENGNPITGYQIAGDYLTTADSANFYTTANESGFITGVPDTYLQNTDLTISDGKITEISGVPLSAGDELPESVSAATDYVTATSANIDSTINNVSANSGAWGGSALPISAGPGIKFEMVDNTLIASTDETVLWTTGSDTSISSFTLNEPISAFDRIRFKAALFNTTEKICGEIAPDSANPLANISFSVGGYIAGEDGNPYQWYGTRYSTVDGLTYNRIDNKWIHMTLTGTTFTYNSNGADRCIMLREIVGVNRIAGE